MAIGLVSALLWLFFKPELDFFESQWFCLWSDSPELLPKNDFFAFKRVNLLVSIILLTNIVGGVIFGFSKEKVEDEYIGKLRLHSLAWAILINYFALALACIFVFGFSFFWIVLFNMFTPLWLYILRFRWLIFRNQKHL